MNETEQRIPNAFLKLDQDAISVDGLVLTRKNVKPVTIVFHKPAGVCGSREEYRSTLYSYLSNRTGWFTPGGTLTKAASGIVIVTNDPTHRDAEHSTLAGLTRDILVKVHRHPKKTELTKLAKLLTERWKDKNADVSVVLHSKNARHSWIKLTYRNGPLHDVMVAMKELKLEPLRVIRSRIGPFNIDDVASGAWYRLSDNEIVALDELAKDRPKEDNVSLQSIWDRVASRLFGTQE